MHSKNIVKEQCKYNLEQTFYSRVNAISKETRVDIEAAQKLRKSTWKKFFKQKIKRNIQNRLWEEMRQKPKPRTIKDNKWERKKYIEQCKTDSVKDIIKIRLHMWDLKGNYQKEEEQPQYPLCKTEDDTTVHVLQCGRDRDRKHRNIKNNNEEEWKEVVQVFRENKRKRDERREEIQQKRSSLDSVFLYSHGQWIKQQSNKKIDNQIDNNDNQTTKLCADLVGCRR